MFGVWAILATLLLSSVAAYEQTSVLPIARRSQYQSVSLPTSLHISEG